jgi:hypothetical protein
MSIETELENQRELRRVSISLMMLEKVQPHATIAS